MAHDIGHMPPTPLLHRGLPMPRRSALTSAPGQEQTRSVLRAARRRRALLGWLPGLPTGTGPTFDLVLTRDGPIAVESLLSTGDLSPTHVEGVASRARDAAREAESVLGAAGCFYAVPPVVAVWGGDAYAVPSGGGVLHGVLFLRGRELRPWLSRERARARVLSAVDARDLIVRLSLLPAT